MTRDVDAQDREVPASQQCTLPNCSTPATDLTRPGALCPHHLNGDAEDAPSRIGESERETITPKDADLTDHYASVHDAVAPLATYKSNPTILNADTSRWYVTRENIDPAPDEVGVYPKERRPRSFAADYDATVRHGVTTLYVTTTWNEPSPFETWTACRYDDEAGGYAYKTPDGPAADATPTPDWTETVAYSVWADLDLRDDLKAERGTGGAGWTDDRAAVVSAVYEQLVAEVAPLVGGRDAVFLLDSVGGGYLLTPPGVTYPIARHYAEDPAARERVFSALNDRANAAMQDAIDCAHAAVAGANDVLGEDVVNNVNRPYKAPLSVHASYPAVVTPLDTNAVDYGDPTPLDAVTDALLDRTQAWCERLTSRDYETDARTAALVGTLWDADDAHDLDADPGAWRDLLDEWVAAEREREAERDRDRRAAREHRKRREARGDTLRADAPGDAEDVRITTVKADVLDAVDRLDTERVAEATIVSEWTDRASGLRDTAGNGKRGFVPEWATGSCNGTATYINCTRNYWNDTGKVGGFGCHVEMALYDLGERHESETECVTGERWARGVEHLRVLGFDIPVYLPDATSLDAVDGPDGDPVMPHWALKKAALTFGVVEDDGDFKRHTDAETDETYAGFDMTTWNATLGALDAAGLTHGREYSIPDSLADTTADGVDANTDADDVDATVADKEVGQ